MSRLGWAASSTFLIGDLYVGVRSNSPTADALVGALLAPHLVEEVEAPPNYSLHLGGEEGGVKGVHLLYRTHRPVVRTRRPRRLWEGLVGHLDQFLERSHDRLLEVSALGLVRDSRAVLVPANLGRGLEALVPRLHRRAVQLVDRPYSLVDPVRAELVVEEPALEIDRSVLRGLEDLDGVREPPPVPPGRYPLLAWGLPVAEAEGAQPLSAAESVISTLGAVRNRGALGTRAILEGLAELVGAAPVLRLPRSSDAVLADAVAGLFSAER